MAKLDGPLMSMGASGSIGGMLTFGKNKGRNYVRQLVIPSNPQTAAQMGVRSLFGWLGKEWAQLTVANQATWETKAAQTVISPFAAFMAQSMDNWSNAKAGQRQDPAEASAPPSIPTTIADTVTARRANITWVDPATGDTFGLVYYHSLTTGFSPGRDNAVAVIDAGVRAFTTKTLAPATYYYRLRGFDYAGIFGTVSAEGSFVIA